MVRFATMLILGLALLWPARPGHAQEQEAGAPFAGYAALYAHVEAEMATGNYARLLRRLGTGPERTDAQLATIEGQLRDLYPVPLKNSSRLRLRNMADGFREELRVYWAGQDYLWLHLLTHRRPEGVYVVSFTLNNDAAPALSAF